MDSPYSPDTWLQLTPDPAEGVTDLVPQRGVTGPTQCDNSSGSPLETRLQPHGQNGIW